MSNGRAYAFDVHRYFEEGIARLAAVPVTGILPHGAIDFALELLDRVFLGTFDLIARVPAFRGRRVAARRAEHLLIPHDIFPVLAVDFEPEQAVLRRALLVVIALTVGIDRYADTGGALELIQFSREILEHRECLQRDRPILQLYIARYCGPPSVSAPPNARYRLGEVERRSTGNALTFPGSRPCLAFPPAHPGRVC
jgi:hypothetical protein